MAGWKGIDNTNKKLVGVEIGTYKTYVNILKELWALELGNVACC